MGSSSLDGKEGGGSFSVRASASQREVVAVLEVEEGSALELVVRLPLAMPLKAPEVECRWAEAAGRGRAGGAGTASGFQQGGVEGALLPMAWLCAAQVHPRGGAACQACLLCPPPRIRRRNMGVADARLRKWMLSISSALRNANASIADAILQWQRAVRIEFSGGWPGCSCL